MVGKITKWSYLEPLVYNEEFVHLAEISVKLKKNHSVVRQYLNEFVKEGVLNKKSIGRMTSYKINYKNPLIIDILTIIEKERIILSAKRSLILKEIISSFNQKNKNTIIILFGSAVIDTKNAKDIDILTTGKGLENKIIEKLERKINKKIHLITVKEFASITQALKTEIKNKHLIIKGTEETIRWLI